MIELSVNKTCFFTGHRNLPKNKIEKIKQQLKQIIIDKYNEGINCFMSGGAMGFDTLAAQIVLELKKQESYSDIKLILYVPCYHYDKKWDYTDRCVLQKLKYAADKFIIVSKCDYTPECNRIRNQRMVDDSICGIAYKLKNLSGTAQTIRIAQKQNKSVINIADII